MHRCGDHREAHALPHLRAPRSWEGGRRHRVHGQGATRKSGDTSPGRADHSSRGIPHIQAEDAGQIRHPGVRHIGGLRIGGDPAYRPGMPGELLLLHHQTRQRRSAQLSGGGAPQEIRFVPDRRIEGDPRHGTGYRGIRPRLCRSFYVRCYREMAITGSGSG